MYYSHFCHSIKIKLLKKIKYINLNWYFYIPIFMFISIIQDQLKNLRFLLSFYAIYIIKMLNVRIIESCLFFFYNLLKICNYLC